MTLAPGPARWVGVALVLLATALWAGIGATVRLVQADTWTVVFWRGSFSGLTLLSLAAFRARRGLVKEFRGIGRYGLVYALASALGTLLYIVSIHMTSVTDVSVIYATMPFLTAALAWLWLRNPSDKLTLAASLVAMVGVAITAGGAIGTGPLAGQAVAVIMTLAYAGQVVVMRRQSGVEVAPLVCLAAFLAAAASLPMAQPLSTPGGEIAILAFSGIVPGALGDVLFARGTQLIPPTRAALLTTLDAPLATFFVWLAAGELPVMQTVIGGAVILLAVVGHLLFCSGGRDRI